MATILSNPEVMENEDEGRELPDARVLEDKFPEAWKTSRLFVGYAFFIAAIYWVFNFVVRLWHTDLWGHLSYGQRLWEAKAIPATEPLMPLAKGVRFVDTAWLSELIGFGAISAWGPTALTFLYAGSITLCCGLILWRLHQRTENPLIAVGATLIFLAINWWQLQIVRPQLAGLVCFVLMFVLLTTRRWDRRIWIAIPVISMLWANLHGSFIVGVGMLGCFFVGRAFDVARRTRSIKTVILDTKVRRYLLLTELAACAALINPYGLGLYAEVLAFGSNHNLNALIEWFPMQITTFQGQAMAISVMVFFFLYRTTPRRVSGVEVLLLVALGLAAMWTSRMLTWWAPIAAYYTALHANAIWNRYKRRNNYPVRASVTGAGLWTVVAAGIAWCAFGFTPFAMRVLHGKDTELTRLVSDYTPVAAAEYLKKNPPIGQVFNTYELGDYLLWAGPKDMQLFVASHAHLLPNEVWKAYLQVIRTESGWEETLALYSVNTIVLDERYRSSLIDRLKRNEEWGLAFEDDVAAVFRRKHPIK